MVVIKDWGIEEREHRCLLEDTTFHFSRRICVGDLFYSMGYILNIPDFWKIGKRGLETQLNS